jgi:hypothetical protein
VEKRCTFWSLGCFGSSYLDILVGSGDALGAFPGAVGVVLVCPYGFYVVSFIISIFMWKYGVRFCRLSLWLGVV